MLLLDFFDISVSLESAKNHWNRGLHIWRTPWIIHDSGTSEEYKPARLGSTNLVILESLLFIDNYNKSQWLIRIKEVFISLRW